MSTALPPRYFPGVAGAARGAPDVGGARRFSRAILVQTLIVGGVPAALIAAGAGRSAGLFFWAVAGAALLRLAILRRYDTLLALLVALSPFINFLRGFAFYNVVGVLFLGALALRFASSPAAWPAFLRRYPLVAWLAVYLGAYWAASYAVTRRYDVNARVWEFLFTVVTVLVLGRRLALLSGALRGLTASVVLVGLSLIPHLGGTEQDRLGIVLLEGRSLGNPIQLGVPLVLIFLVLLTDRGRAMGLQRTPMIRAALLFAISGMLLLTTSRAAWLVAAAGSFIALLFGRGNRKAVLAALGVILFVVQVALLTPSGGGLKAAIERTFSGERSLQGRTSGRSDQWVVAYYAVTESARTLLFGHGPGRGARVYAEKSLEVQSVDFYVGQEMLLHSLYMQLGVEVGLLGLAGYLFWMTAAAKRIVARTRPDRLLPLVCFTGYALIAATVSGSDTASGLFVGIGLLATGSHLLRGRRPLVRVPRIARLVRK